MLHALRSAPPLKTDRLPSDAPNTQVDGHEWSYGCTTSEEEVAVLANTPKMHPDHHYRHALKPCVSFAG